MTQNLQRPKSLYDPDIRNQCNELHTVMYVTREKSE
jgi:hypothetical protein